MSNKLIGKGSFTKVFHDGKSPVVVMSSFNKTKECLASGWMPESELLPVVDFLGQVGGLDDSWQLYKMPYFASLKQRAVKPHLDAESWALYQQLRTLSKDLQNHFLSSYGMIWRGHQIYSDSLRIINQSGLSDSIKDFMLGCYQSLSNYGQDVRFEISPSNVATENGKLILVGCFFFSNDVKSTRTAGGHLAHNRNDIKALKELDLSTVEAV